MIYRHFPIPLGVKLNTLKYFSIWLSFKVAAFDFLFYKVTYVVKNEQNLILLNFFSKLAFKTVLPLWLYYLGHHQTFDAHIAIV